MMRTLDDIAGAAGFLAAIATAAVLWSTPAPALGPDRYDDDCPDTHAQGARLVLTIRNGSSVRSDKVLETCAGTVVLAITVRAGVGDDLYETYAVVEAPDGLIAFPVEIDVMDNEEGTISFLPAMM